MSSLDEAAARPRGLGTAMSPAAADLGAAAVIAAVAAVLFVTAPHAGDFWWSDVPRHALNGVFIRDLLAAFPIHDPVGWATAYYLRYPALTILFYPPLLYVLSAPFHAVLGVSHASALLPVILGYLGFGLGAHALYRRWVGPGFALTGALLLMAAPIMLLWGRQVMLELPCYAFLVWSLVAVLRHADTGRPAPLYAALLLFLAALYTKQTMIFMGLPVLLLLFRARGRALLRDRHAWIVAALGMIGLLPLVLMAMKFGQANAQSVTGVEDRLVARDTLAGWLWYLRGLPAQLGWPPAILAGLGACALLAMPRWRPARRDGLFLVAWFATGYVVFSAIDLKDLRFTGFLLVPVLVPGLILLDRLASGRGAPAAAVVLGLLTLTAHLAAHPVPRIEGYQAAVALVAERAPPGSAVLFSGYRDGNFIFGMRAREDRRDLRVLRADKLLLTYAVRRELGVAEKSYSEAEIGDLLNRYGVSYVVAQTGFWTDLAAMRRLDAVLASPQFEPVARLAVTGNVPHPDRELVVYRNRGPVAPPGAAIELDLPIIGRKLDGKLE